MRVDELLEALPEVGLQLWMLCDNGAEGWHAVIHDRGQAPISPWRHDGNGATPQLAIIQALEGFGINVEP